ncbi:MAG: biotin transporter BioY [Clostridia bacterium]|nr:biotin transporter BioY [Clostridia bacterium]
MSASAKALTRIGFSAAFLAILSQIALPLPMGVPLTLQTFGISLCGSLLGKKQGIAAVAVWLLLGMMGAPVFHGFQGGFAHFLGYTGGFLWGFLALAFLCGGKSIHWSLLGIALCHIIGIIQFMLISGNPFWVSLMQASLPYLLKDIVLTLGGIRLGKKLKGIL